MKSLPITLEEALKTETWECVRCGGPLIVHKYVWEKQIKSINYCKNYWDQEGK